jgi:hypothetical protein
VDHEGGAVVVHQVNNLDDPAARPATDYKPFFPVDLSWKSTACTADNRLNLLNRAAMFGCVFQIPLYPPELLGCHEITI